MSLTVTIDRVGTVVVARLAGDLDRAAEAPLGQLGSALVGADGLVLDFTDTTFIASSGLALLVGLVRQASAQQASVAAVGLDDHYRHVFEITRLDEFIRVTDDDQAALAAVSGGNP